MGIMCVGQEGWEEMCLEGEGGAALATMALRALCDMAARRLTFLPRESCPCRAVCPGAQYVSPPPSPLPFRAVAHAELCAQELHSHEAAQTGLGGISLADQAAAAATGAAAGGGGYLLEQLEAWESFTGQPGGAKAPRILRAPFAMQVGGVSGACILRAPFAMQVKMRPVLVARQRQRNYPEALRWSHHLCIATIYCIASSYCSASICTQCVPVGPIMLDTPSFPPSSAVCACRPHHVGHRLQLRRVPFLGGPSQEDGRRGEEEHALVHAGGLRLGGSHDNASQEVVGV